MSSKVHLYHPGETNQLLALYYYRLNIEQSIHHLASAQEIAFIQKENLKSRICESILRLYIAETVYKKKIGSVFGARKLLSDKHMKS